MSPLGAVLVLEADDALAVADHLGGLRAGDHRRHSAGCASLRVSTASARSCASNSIRVTWLTRPARSMAASTPELPPPITATRLPLNKRTVAVRTVGHAAVAIFALARHVDLAPARAGRDDHGPGLERRAAAQLHFDEIARNPALPRAADSSRPHRRWSTCCSRPAASLCPSVSLTEMKFSMPTVSSS